MIIVIITAFRNVKGLYYFLLFFDWTILQKVLYGNANFLIDFLKVIISVMKKYNILLH